MRLKKMRCETEEKENTLVYIAEGNEKEGKKRTTQEI